MPRATNNVTSDPLRYIAMPILVEFLSQFMMTFWGVMTERPQTSKAGGNNTMSKDIDVDDYMMNTFAPAFQTGISVWVCITLFSKMSYAPAQFNPSVTTTFVVIGTVPPILFIPIVAAQCVASLFASYLSQIIRGARPLALIIPDEANSWSIFLSEVILVAFVMVFAAELTENPSMNDPTGVFALGMTVFMAILSGKWTGVVCISPSRAFGPAVLTGGAAWNRHWLLWIADIIGSAGAGIFWLVFLAPLDRAWIGRFARKGKKKEDILMNDKNVDEMKA